MALQILSCTLALCLLCHWVSGDAPPRILCPPAGETVTDKSSCTTECYEDSQCQTSSGSNSTLCCPTSMCGSQCVTGLTAHRHPPILSCPQIDDDVVGACYQNCEPSGDSCSEGELCCSNGCGRDCVTAVQVTPICRAILESHNGSFNVGEYVPQCDDDGMFLPAQCHGSSAYCWCVRPETGEAVGRKMTRFYQPECLNCTHKGEVYYPGDSFSDDCNTCFCSENGMVGCTEIGCHPPGCFHKGQWFVPGDSFSDDCNTCFCSEDGTVSCTEIECNPPSNGDNSTSSLFLSCPVLEDDVIGVCSDMCQSDSDCTSGQKCCRNGCGALACLDSVPIPYISPSRECPEEVICNNQECTDSCEDPNQLCCQNDCGSQVCVDGELPPFPCTKTVNGLTGETLLGQFIPKCDEEDGTFSKLQCSSHYCWCVDGQSGQPTSVMVESGSVGALECSGCSFEQTVYEHGSVVESHGECAKSKCLAGELVRTEECGKYQCEHDGQTYDHGETLQDDCYCMCLDGNIACASSDTPCATPGQCVHNGIYHNVGDAFLKGDGCNTCTCSKDYEVACTEVACENNDEVGSDELEWWHSFVIGAGAVIAVLAVIAIALLVVMVMVIRSSQFRHKRLQESSDMLSFEQNTPVQFKSGLPEAESVELKVPVEDDTVPVDT